MGFFSKIGDWWNDNVYEPLVDGVTGIVNDVSDWWNDNIYEPIEDLGTGISDWFDNTVDNASDLVDTIGEGVTNTWNKYTGNAHLTPEYQHAEQREDTVNQRTAEDLQNAGLSKFAMSASPAGTSSAANGLTMLDAVSKMQDIKAQKFALKQAKYNLGISKRLGIRTGDKNSLAQLTSIMSALFGLNLDDVPKDGIVPWFFEKIFGGNDGNGSHTGAFTDTAGAAMNGAASANPLADPMMIESHGLLSVGDVESKFVGILSKVTNNFTSDINGANLKKVMDASVSSLENQGYTWMQSANMVNSWLKRYLKNYDNLEWNLYITTHKKEYTDSSVSSPVTTSRPSGGGHAW